MFEPLIGPGLPGGPEITLVVGALLPQAFTATTLSVQLTNDEEKSTLTAEKLDAPGMLPPALTVHA